MQRFAGITYYEELGVRESATPEQIRDAFRTLVRLLHPDQQTDEQLRIIAESQMRKLNRIYSVLSDPDRRRGYDQSIHELVPAPPVVFTPRSLWNPQRFLARFAWVGAVLIAVAVLAWLASEGPPPAVLQVPDRPGAPPKVNSAAPSSADFYRDITQLRADLKTVRAERDNAIQELARLRGLPVRRVEVAASAPLEHPVPQQPIATTTTELPAPVPALQPVHTPAPAKPTPAPGRTFNGFWFYTPPGSGQHNKNTSLYPPDFIEATLTEQNGTVHGRYRSRYQIVDRAISPDVNFEFTGSANGTTIACPWSGTAGARGELRLKLTGENSMEIEWTATELGSVQGLVSGTAKLTRRLD